MNAHITNYFTLFGLNPDFLIDMQGLNQAYRDLQAQYHPDKFVNDVDIDKRQVLEKSAEINHGFQVLKSDMKRAAHLLALQGIDVNADRTIHDADLLMQQLMLREQLEEIAQDKNETALAAFAAQIDSLYQVTKQKLHIAFNSNNLSDATVLATELKFLTRLQQQISDLEDELF